VVQVASVKTKPAVKVAELLSSLGALALGLGLGASLPGYVGRAALPLLVAGIISHRTGMFWRAPTRKRSERHGCAMDAAALRGMLLGHTGTSSSFDRRQSNEGLGRKHSCQKGLEKSDGHVVAVA
jgi:hypothetical protein